MWFTRAHPTRSSVRFVALLLIPADHARTFAAGFLVVAVAGSLELGEAQPFQVLWAENGLLVPDCRKRRKHAMTGLPALGAVVEHGGRSSPEEPRIAAGTPHRISRHVRIRKWAWNGRSPWTSRKPQASRRPLQAHFCEVCSTINCILRFSQLQWAPPEVAPPRALDIPRPLCETKGRRKSQS